jgi:hypothetical protein
LEEDYRDLLMSLKDQARRPLTTYRYHDVHGDGRFIIASRKRWMSMHRMEANVPLSVLYQAHLVVVWDYDYFSDADWFWKHTPWPKKLVVLKDRSGKFLQNGEIEFTKYEFMALLLAL